MCICLGLSFSFLWHLPLLDPTSWNLLLKKKKKKVLQSFYQVCSSNAVCLFSSPSLTQVLFFLQFKCLIIWNFILCVDFELWTLLRWKSPPFRWWNSSWWLFSAIFHASSLLRVFIPVLLLEKRCDIWHCWWDWK